MTNTKLPATTRVSRPGGPAGGAARLKELASRYYLQAILVAGVLLLAATEPNFRSLPNLQNVLLQASFAGIVACGMTLLIAGGLFDLSVAGIIAVCAVATAKILPTTTIGVAIGVALLIGLGLGVLNGLIVTKIRIPAFIATLGMLNIYLAVAFIWTQGKVVPIVSVNFLQLANARILGIPLAFVIFAVVCILSHVLLHRTYFGRSLRAVGSSEQAAVMAGLPVARVKILAFALTGLFTAVAAVMLSGLLSSANGTMATGFELNAIAIAVVGGTALRGGQGTLLGTFTGALVFAALNNALNLLGVDPYWQYIAIGAVLVAALALGALKKTTVRGAE
jgi:ribose/xylose/arabinose/galactoside ABC-type transport system permease subunit